MSPAQCGNDKAPSGYACTRQLGHEGPCAAVPMDERARNLRVIAKANERSEQEDIAAKARREALFEAYAAVQRVYDERQRGRRFPLARWVREAQRAIAELCSTAPESRFPRGKS